MLTRIKRQRNNERGIAIILVLSILAVLVALGAAFLITSRLESIKAQQFVEGVRATYIAEAGLNHAKRLLREDKSANGIDTEGEVWHSAFIGADATLGNGPATNAQWMTLVDAAGVPYGRYAVYVSDEAGKVNINTAGFHNTHALRVTEGYSPFEVSLTRLFETLGYGNAQAMMESILSYRYGGNVPGESDIAIDDNQNELYLAADGLDNDADGLVDEADEGINEPEEFVWFAPYGDDRPFFSVFDMIHIPTMAGVVNDIVPYMTAHSYDMNTSSTNQVRLDLNQASPLDVMQALASTSLSGSGQLAVNIVDYRDTDYESSALLYNGVTYYGVEGVRINEVMISPRMRFRAVDGIGPLGPGGNWKRVDDHCENDTPSLDVFTRGVWHYENIRPGTYYLQLFGQNASSLIGDVEVNGVTHTQVHHGELFVNPVEVAADGRLDITIYNREIDQGEHFTTFFTGFYLQQSPDVEYIELINITPKTIDISGWSVEGLRNNDSIGTIPAGTIIGSFDYCVLAIDKDDISPTVPDAIRNNGISLLGVWSGSSIRADHVVQLTFSDDVARTDDMVPDALAPHQYISLKTSDQKIVDRLEYASYNDEQSSERGDPASQEDRNGNGIGDGLLPSEGMALFPIKGTPTQQNNNLSMSGHLLGGLSSEALVKNGAFSNAGELPFVSTGVEWAHMTTSDLMLCVDLFTTNAVRFESEGRLASVGGWQEVPRVAPYTDWCVSLNKGDEGEWAFTKSDRIPEGTYMVTLYAQPGDILAVSFLQQDGNWKPYSPALASQADGSIRYGFVTVGGTEPTSLSAQAFSIKIKNESENGEAHFDYVVFSPSYKIGGRININTASLPVLQALPGISEERAQAIMNARPYGNTYGIGDILQGTILGPDETTKKEQFKKICNLITVKSNVFEVMVVGQSLRNDQKTAEKRLRVVVER